MKNIIILLALFLFQFGTAQTITKTANKNSVKIGEEFKYIIEIKNTNDWGDLVQIQDNLGGNVDLIDVKLSPVLQQLEIQGFCSPFTYTSPQNNVGLFTFDFNNCGGSSIGVNNVYIELFVKLNSKLCSDDKFTNTASLKLRSGQLVNDSFTINIDHTDPFQLQKNFIKYDAGLDELVYDVRLSAINNDFSLLDPNGALFSDEFVIPSCMNLQPNDIEVSYVQNSSGPPVSIPYTASITGSTLRASWGLPSSFSSSLTSMQFFVKIRNAGSGCNCGSNVFDLNNTAFFDGNTICGNLIHHTKQDLIEGVNCDFTELNNLGDCELNFRKSVSMIGNDFPLTMEGCVGTYTIVVDNCSSIYKYGYVEINDVLPQELDILSINSNGWSQNRSGNTIKVTGGGLGPGNSHVITIDFKVNTPLPNHLIRNCATVDVKATNINNGSTKYFSDESCASIRTVPNEVALVTEKGLCTDPNRSCGIFNNSNFLPDDIVEYVFLVYNYGTKTSPEFNLIDQLPTDLKIQNVATDIQVYKIQTANSMNDIKPDCNISNYSNITNSVNANLSGSNKLTIDFNLNELNAFTCDGITAYKVKIKGKLDRNVQNGTYPNQFEVNYKDVQIGMSRSQISNNEPITVFKDGLVMVDKRRVNSVPQVDCEKHETKVRYQIRVSNMGVFPVFVDISDQIPNVPGVSSQIVAGSFSMQSSTGTGSLSNANPTNPTSLTVNSFEYRRLKLNSCEMRLIEFDVIFNTVNLVGEQSKQVCNSATIKAYTEEVVIVRNTGLESGFTKIENPEIIILEDDDLIMNYLLAENPNERLQAIILARQVMEGNENIEGVNYFNGNRLGNVNSLGFGPWTLPVRKIDIGTKTVQDCFQLSDCLAGKQNTCAPNGNSENQLHFNINSVDNNGIISTTLTNNTGKQITQVDYIFSDVVYHPTCRRRQISIGGRPNWLFCKPCSGESIGSFESTSTLNLGSLQMQSTNPAIVIQNHHEQNKVSFKGPATNLTTANRSFKFPGNVNCDGSYDFTITAVVYYDDCSVCYVSDAFDFKTTSLRKVIDVLNIRDTNPILIPWP